MTFIEELEDRLDKRAAQIADKNPHWTPTRIYNEARASIIRELRGYMNQMIVEKIGK